MTRKEVREFVKAGVDALTPVHEFGCGLITDWNWIPDKTLPQIWQELQPVNGTNPPTQAPVDDWNIVIHIARRDKMDSKPDQYNDIIDECDLVAQKLMAQYNSIVSGYKLVTLTNRSRVPFVKKHAHDLTGVILSFRLNAPDKTPIC